MPLGSGTVPAAAVAVGIDQQGGDVVGGLGSSQRAEQAQGSGDAEAAAT